MGNPYFFAYCPLPTADGSRTFQYLKPTNVPGFLSAISPIPAPLMDSPLKKSTFPSCHLATFFLTYHREEDHLLF